MVHSSSKGRYYTTKPTGYLFLEQTIPLGTATAYWSDKLTMRPTTHPTSLQQLSCNPANCMNHPGKDMLLWGGICFPYLKRNKFPTLVQLPQTFQQLRETFTWCIDWQDMIDDALTLLSSGVSGTRLYTQRFCIHPKWCRKSTIDSSNGKSDIFTATVLLGLLHKNPALVEMLRAPRLAIVQGEDILNIYLYTFHILHTQTRICV